ncbi:hypothetical protein [Cupriavidus necator]
MALLLLCIASGLAGTQNNYANFNMTFIWVICVIVVPYAVAILGDFYAVINPWKALIELIEFVMGGTFTGVITLPDGFRYCPALGLYMGFVYLELFSETTPYTTSMALMCYAACNITGASLLGKDKWFSHGEFFGVMLRLIGALAPFEWKTGAYQRGTDVQVCARSPMDSLGSARGDDMSLVLFILFMLSSTGFDGIHGTAPWVTFFWENIDPVVVGFLDLTGRKQLLFSAQMYLGWQRAMLFLSPFFYLAVLMGTVTLVARISHPSPGVWEAALRLAPSLVPIALAYHVAHYFTLAFSQAGQIMKLASDPLGIGWNIFGTATKDVAPVMFDLGAIWHAQVAFILIGHIAGIYFAHVDTMRSAPCRARAVFAQLPVLALMVLFTTVGLWILSLPLAGGR